jgi:hypothetical protein
LSVLQPDASDFHDPTTLMPGKTRAQRLNIYNCIMTERDSKAIFGVPLFMIQTVDPNGNHPALSVAGLTDEKDYLQIAALYWYILTPADAQRLFPPSLSVSYTIAPPPPAPPPPPRPASPVVHD